MQELANNPKTSTKFYIPSQDNQDLGEKLDTNNNSVNDGIKDNNSEMKVIEEIRSN